MKVCYVVGARPNFVKMAPVIAALRGRAPHWQHVVVHTGQHYDREMSAIFIEQLALQPPDFVLNVGSGTHAQQTARAMERLEPVFAEVAPDLIIVPGDVNSTLAATLVAVKLGVPLAHIESGLRSFDRTMPEEINRIVADEFADFLFAHSEEALANLRAEGISADRVHLVGNTMIDTLVAMEPVFRGLAASEKYGLEGGGYLLVTLHRPALVDGPLLPCAMEQLNRIAADLPVVFPVHPRTRKYMGSIGLSESMILLEPVGYLEFLSLMTSAAAVLTDSGGVQEETTYLGIPCFTLRSGTERPVTIRLGTNHLLGLNPQHISDILPALKRGIDVPATPPPFWDGHAAERVADVLLDAFDRS
jgi:UDP-N-acetylglucosamine 2-epimerase (non-hydrolysing)